MNHVLPLVLTMIVRSLIKLSAALMCAACAVSSFAGPSLDVRSDLVNSQGAPAYGHIPVPYALSSDPDPVSVDLTEFISGSWRSTDGEPSELFALSPNGLPLPVSSFSSDASAEEYGPSVPEIPLPMPLIPMALGLGYVVLAHRKSLRSHRFRS